MSALWTVKLINPTGDEMVPQWTGGRFVSTLAPHDSFSFTVPGSLDVVERIIPYQSDVLLAREGVNKARLRLLPFRRSLGASHHVALTAVDYRAVLHHRIVHAQRVYSATAQTSIVWDLVAYTQGLTSGALGITAGTLTAGTPRDKTVDAGVPIGKTIDDMRDNINGFDWWVDASLALHVVSPRRTRDRSGTILQLGATLASADETPPDRFLNVVRQTGAEGLTADTQTALPDARGRWEGNFGDTDLKEQASVTARAQRRLADATGAPHSWVARVRLGEWGQTVDLDPGDVTRLRLAQDGYLFDGLVRVHEVSYSLPEEQVTLSLLEEP